MLPVLTIVGSHWLCSMNSLVVALRYNFTVPTLIDMHKSVCPINRNVVYGAIIRLWSSWVMPRRRGVCSSLIAGMNFEV